MRGLAVVLVVLYHAGGVLPGGFIGVDVFFVVSGFVITRLLWEELSSTHTLDLKRFYTRRVRRLLPALCVVLIFVAVASLALDSPLGGQQLTARTGISAALFSANAALFVLTGGYFDAPAEANPLLHTWTLAVEEQFYLAFPLVLLAGWAVARRSRNPRGSRAVVLVVAATLALSLAAGIFLTYTDGLPFGSAPVNHSFAFFASPTRAWEFAAGALLALAPARVARMPQIAVRTAAGGGAVLIALAAVFYTEETPFPGVAAMLPVLGTCLLIVGGTATTHGVTRLLTGRAITWLGDRSYSWYLWHWPFIVFAGALRPEASPAWLVSAALASLVPAALAYRYLEDPIRRGTAWGHVGSVRLALVCTVAPIVLFMTAAPAANSVLAPVQDLRVQSRPHLDETRHCTANLPSDPRTSRDCTWTVPGTSRGRILLLGDSNAGHFAEPALSAASGLGYDLTLATFGGCPFADVRVEYEIAYDENGCARFVSAWTAEVTHSPPVAVILSNASTEYLSAGNGLALTAGTSSAARTTAAKAAHWQAGLGRTLQRWSDIGVPTIVVHTVPHFQADLRACPVYRIMTDQGACGARLPRNAVDQQLKAARDAEVAATSVVLRAGTLDLTADICSATTCATHRGGTWLYRDGAHLSVPFAMTLAERFTSAVRRAVRTSSLEPPSEPALGQTHARSLG